MASPLQKLVGYELVANVARGGMARVFSARAPNGELVAIKQMRPELEANDDFETMFADEAAVSLRLRHPNLVRSIAFGTLDGASSLVMELLEGTDLRWVLRDASRRGERVPVGLLVGIAREVCSGLHYAHELDARPGHDGIVHRDVSPQNVYLTHSGEVKVVDFGIAKSEKGQVETRSGMLKGKVRYMAPEQLRGERVGRTVDLYALGVMLYEGLTGFLPYAVPSDAPEMSLMLAIARHDLVPVSRRGVAVDPSLADVLTRALAAEPHLRFSTAEEMGQALAATGLVPSSDEYRQLFRAHVAMAIEGRKAAKTAPREASPSKEEGESVARLARSSHVFVERVADVSVVSLEGALDESFRGGEMGRSLREALVLDLSAVGLVRRRGLEEVLDLFRNVRSPGRVFAYRAPANLARRLAAERAFVSCTLSFAAEFRCLDCGLDVPSLSRLGESSSRGPCSRCGGKVEPLDWAKRVQLGQMDPDAVPDAVREAIAELDARSDRGAGELVEKSVRGDETRFLLRSFGKRRPNWRRVLEGVEGHLVVELGYDEAEAVNERPSLELLVERLRELGSDVASVSFERVPLSLLDLLPERASTPPWRVKTLYVEDHCAVCKARRGAVVDLAEARSAARKGALAGVECMYCGEAMASARISTFLGIEPVPGPRPRVGSAAEDTLPSAPASPPADRDPMRWLVVAALVLLALTVALVAWLGPRSLFGTSRTTRCGGTDPTQVQS
jgi:serine/threonine protein kinase